jgi:hypothetical protein
MLLKCTVCVSASQQDTHMLLPGEGPTTLHEMTPDSTHLMDPVSHMQATSTGKTGKKSTCVLCTAYHLHAGGLDMPWRATHIS